jgi:pimeloyl-ACP methyl ester carboxylesterase
VEIEEPTTRTEGDIMSHTTPETIPHYGHRRGHGPTLVLLHYWGGSSRTWAPLVAQLAGRDVLTIDARGWGHSRTLPGPYTLQQMADDTLAVLADAGVSDYVVVGHSMGGKVAQLLAGLEPSGLKGIVLVAPAPARPADHVTPEYQQGLAHAYDSVESVAGARDHVLTASALPEALARQVEEDSLRSAEDARSAWPLAGISDDISDRVARATVPALVVAGENDLVEPPEVLRTHLMPYLARGELVVVVGSGHLIPLEAPAALRRAVEALLAGLDGGEAPSS